MFTKNIIRKNKIKVNLILPSNKNKGGVENIVYNIYSNLIQDPEIICKITYLNNTKLIPLIKELKSSNIIHSHIFDIKKNFTLFFISFLLNKPLITTIHSTFGVESKISISNLLKNKKKIISAFYIITKIFPTFFGNQIIYISESVKLASHLWSKFNAKEHVIYNSISQKSFNKKNNHNRIYPLAFIGRLSKEKNPELAIKCAINSGIKIHIFGDGELKNYLINKYGKNKFVQFHGWINNMDNYYYNIKVIIAPSTFEGLPLTIISAIQNSCISILSDIPAFREINRKFPKSTYIYKNKENLIEKIIELTSKKIDLNNNEKFIAKEIYSISSFIKKHKQVYLETAKKL